MGSCVPGFRLPARTIATIHLFLLQILHRNTACAHLSRLASRSFTASAYCQARSRLPVRVLQAILQRLTAITRPLALSAGAGAGAGALAALTGLAAFGAEAL